MLSFPPKGLRALAMMLFKAEGEIEGGREAGLVGDLRESLVSVSKQVPGLVEPLRFEILAECLANLTPKERGKA